MRQHAVGRHAMTHDDVFGERNHGLHLRRREIRVAVLVSGILNFYADRMRVDVGLAAPVRSARVPGAQRFRHKLRDAAVFGDHIMAGDAAFCAGQPVDCLRRRRHARVVQNEKRRPGAAAAWLPVFSQMNPSDERTVGRERHALGSNALSARWPRSARMAS